MNIVVCVKPVPDTSIITIDPQKGLIDSDDLVYIINPYDMVAVEEAVRIKENHGGRVTLVSLAPPETKKLLRRCLALGADEAKLIWDRGFDKIDSYATGMILAGLIGSSQYDLVLCGQKAIDTEAGQVGSIIAERLDMPLGSRVVKIDVDPDNRKVDIESKLEKGNRARMEINLPAVLTVELDLNEPRYTGLPSLIVGLRADISEYNLATIGLSHAEAGLETTKTRTIAIATPKPRPKKVFTPDSSLSAAERLRLIMSGGVTPKKSDRLEGAPEDIASTVVQFLTEKKFVRKLHAGH